MYRPLPLFIGFRYVYGKKSDGFGRFVSWLSMIGIALGSMGLIVVLSIMNGFEDEMQKSILQFMPQAQITGPNESLNIQHYPAEQFATLNGQTKLVPLVTSDVVVQSAASIGVTTLMGIDPSKPQDEPIVPYLIAGSLSDLVEGQYQVIIGSQLADQLGVSLGQPIRVMVTNASQITPVGRIPNQRLFTVVGLFSVNRDINQSLIYVNQEDAKRLMRYSADTISGWRVFLKHPLDISHFVEQTLPAPLKFKDWRDKRGELFQAIRLEKNMMGLLISLIVVVAAFNIITSLSLLVMEKQGEVAILKTQGLTRSRIMSIFIIQGACSGVLGTLIGSAIGIILAVNLNSIMATLRLSFSGIRLPSLVEPMQITIIIIGLLVLSLFATLYPAWRAANIHPAEALRYE